MFQKSSQVYPVCLVYVLFLKNQKIITDVLVKLILFPEIYFLYCFISPSLNIELHCYIDVLP